MAFGSVAEKLFDEGLKQRLLFDNVENSIIIKTNELMERVRESIIDSAKRSAITDPELFKHRKAKFDKEIKNVNSTIVSGYDAIGKVWEDDFLEIAYLTATITAEEMDEIMPFFFNSTLPGRNQLRAMVTDIPFGGQNLPDWISEQTNQMFSRIKKGMNIAITRGETINQMASRINRAFGIGLNDARALVRTSVNHVNNRAREMTHRENEDIIKGEIFIATLDTSTTPFCRKHHTRRYLFSQNKPQLPAHFNCRSVWIPWHRTWVELGIKQQEMPVSRQRFTLRTPDEYWSKKKIRRWLRKQGVGVPDAEASKDFLIKRADIVVGEYRSSLSGTFRADQPYHKWLATQPDFAILDVYGRKRFDMWKRGEVLLSQLETRGGRIWTIKELKENRAKRKTESK